MPELQLPRPPARPQSLVYLGSPPFAVRPLTALVEAGHRIDLVVSQPDKRRGRGGALVPSPVKQAALDLGIPVSDRVADVVDTDADLGVVVAFGRIIRADVLAALPLVNLHYSLLPRWRGAAPVERAILAGDEVTGACIMQIAEALDAGVVYASEEVPIGVDDTAAELLDRLTEVGTTLLLDTIAAGTWDGVDQQGEVTYAAKIDPEERQIDWSLPAVDVHRWVRVGGAWTTAKGKRLKVHRTALVDAAATVDEPSPRAPGLVSGELVATGDGWLRLVEVQPEGKPRVDAAAWANGARLGADDRLGA